MRGKKYLAKNIGLLTISQFGTKLISFFLVPLYTHVLTTAEYGTYDLYTTTISLLIPILTLNVADSALRFTLDKNSDKKSIFTICLKFILVSAFLSGGLIALNNLLGFYNVLNEYSGLFFFLFVATAFNCVMVYFARGLDKVKQVAISGILSSALMILLNLLFLLVLDLHLIGYFYSHILAISAQSLYLFLSTKSYSYISIQHFNKKTQNEMLQYSKPLIINNISWWISSASDRYIVTWLCGLAENGVYSVGYKIPSIINVFQNIFNQAWTLSAVQDYDPEDKSRFFTDMYNSYNFCMTFVCSVLIVLTRLLAKILYSNDFYEAWCYIPFLLIASVFGALSGYIGAIFGAVKDTKIFSQSSIIGAIVNIILNIILVSYIGALGATLATAICYMVTWIIRVISVKKYIKIRFKILRDSIAYTILIIQTVLFFLFADSILFYIVQLFLLLVLMGLFRDEIISVLDLLRRKTRSEL